MSSEFFPDEIYLWIEYFEVVDSVELGLKHKDYRVRWTKGKPPAGAPSRKYRIVQTEA